MLVTAMATLVSVPVAAQAGGDRDTDEISRYKLTEAGLVRYTEATRNLGSLAKGKSDSCASDGEDDVAETGASLDAAVARLESIDGARPAIQSAGMTTREYVVFSWSVLQSGLASWALEQPGGKLPAGVSMDNVSFYRKHETALRKLSEDSKPAPCEGDEGGVE
jgi:hypothetical protein